MWKQAVTRLMGEASLVVMDLRGFGPQRRGCVFELQTLLDAVPLGRLLFLFDTTTDRRALEKLLQEHWQQLDLASPNLASSDATLRLLDVSGGDANAVGDCWRSPNWCRVPKNCYRAAPPSNARATSSGLALPSAMRSIQGASIAGSASAPGSRR